MKNFSIIGLAIALSSVLVACAPAGAGADTATYTVTYEVEWANEIQSISYYNASGGLVMVEVDTITSPWSVTVEGFETNDIPAVIARAPSGSSVTGRILVNGSERESQTGSAVSVTVNL